MKNEVVVMWAICLVICSFLTINVFVGAASLKKASLPLTLNVENLRQRQLGDVEAFLVVADRFAENHVYQDNYTCVNYTSDLARISKELGFRVKVVNGWPANFSQGHSWLRLEMDFETINGFFVDYSKKFPVQEVVGDDRG